MTPPWMEVPRQESLRTTVECPASVIGNGAKDNRFSQGAGGDEREKGGDRRKRAPQARRLALLTCRLGDETGSPLRPLQVVRLDLAVERRALDLQDRRRLGLVPVGVDECL